MRKSTPSQTFGKAYQRLSRQLAAIAWICQGSVIRRSYQRLSGNRMKTYGPYYSWTRKMDNKTVTVALSRGQLRMVQSAIVNHRRLNRLLEQMRRVSEQFIFATTLGVPKRRR